MTIDQHRPESKYVWVTVNGTEPLAGTGGRIRRDLAEQLVRMHDALTVIAGKICGSQCNDPDRKPPLADNKRCAKCIAVDALSK